MGHSNDNRQDTLEYIHSMLGQLRAMADTTQCGMLAYLIEMAYVEAADVRGGPQSRSGPDERDGAA